MIYQIDRPRLNRTGNITFFAFHPSASNFLPPHCQQGEEITDSSLTRCLLVSFTLAESTRTNYPVTMKPLALLQFLLSLSLITPTLASSRSTQRPPGKNAILLSTVQSLTLRANRQTSSRRVSPIPQLKCTGPSKRLCDMYPIDVMRCNNEGYDYDEEDIQWTCTADLPPELKLGATDVICEGYRDADDPWVLKGSCGVEYRMLLTELGEKRFGPVREDERLWSGGGPRGVMAVLGDLIFFGFMAAVFVLILWPMVRQCFGLRGGGPPGRFGRGWGGGGWGGDDGGDGGPYPGQPPPPYSSCVGDDGFASTRNGQGWRPGFWTGALGGAAAGYQMGRRSNSSGSSFGGRRAGRDDPGEGSSRSSRFSTPTTSTGFGSTRRR